MSLKWFNPETHDTVIQLSSSVSGGGGYEATTIPILG
jgi:hypothetical protein